MTPRARPGGQDRDLGHRVGMLREERHQCVPCFMNGHRTLLFGEKCIGPIAPAQQNTIPGLVDVAGEDHVAVVADGDDGSLVDQVGQICPRESGRGPGHGVEIDVGRQVFPLDVHGQDGGPFGLIGQGDLHLTIEATRAEQGGIEHLGTVGGSHDHDPGGGVEAVHLGQKLVEGLLAFVV